MVFLTLMVWRSTETRVNVLESPDFLLFEGVRASPEELSSPISWPKLARLPQVRCQFCRFFSQSGAPGQAAGNCAPTHYRTGPNRRVETGRRDSGPSGCGVRCGDLRRNGRGGSLPSDSRGACRSPE